MGGKDGSPGPAETWKQAVAFMLLFPPLAVIVTVGPLAALIYLINGRM